MVPRFQKEQRFQVCHDILKHFKTELNLLGRVITGDESLIFEYDTSTRAWTERVWRHRYKRRREVQVQTQG